MLEKVEEVRVRDEGVGCVWEREECWRSENPKCLIYGSYMEASTNRYGLFLGLGVYFLRWVS